MTKTARSKNFYPTMVYLSKEEMKAAKSFSKRERVSVSQITREGIRMRIGSAENPYLGGFNDGLRCAMEAARNAQGAQMMFPSGVTFAEMVCTEIERMFRERPTVSELDEEDGDREDRSGHV